MKFIIVFCLTFFISSGWSQDTTTINYENQEDLDLANSYPKGIYLSYEDFLAREPSNTKTVEARNVLRPKQKISDPLIDNCYFNYRRTNKRVKDAFAISYKGSLFIHVKSLQKMMTKKDRKQKIEFKDSFIRVVDQGKYLYLEGYVKKGGGLGFSIGGGPISVGTGGPKEELKGIIFDFENEIFDLFRDCKDFNEFLRTTNYLKTFKCDNKAVPVQVVRKIIFDLNQSYP